MAQATFDAEELKSIFDEINEALKDNDAIGIVTSTGAFTDVIAKGDRALPAKVVVSAAEGISILGALFIKRSADKISGRQQLFNKYKNDESAKKRLEQMLDKMLTISVAPESAKRSAAKEMDEKELLEKKYKEFAADPNPDKWNQPYHLHYYKAHEGSRLRVFDLYKEGLDSTETSIGETVVDNWLPKGFMSRNSCGSYVHFNFGKVPVSQPDKAMEWFAQFHSLTGVKKLGQVKTLGEMRAFQADLVKKLKEPATKN